MPLILFQSSPFSLILLYIEHRYFLKLCKHIVSIFLYQVYLKSSILQYSDKQNIIFAFYQIVIFVIGTFLMIGKVVTCTEMVGMYFLFMFRKQWAFSEMLSLCIVNSDYQNNYYFILLETNLHDRRNFRFPHWSDKKKFISCFRKKIKTSE